MLEILAILAVQVIGAILGTLSIGGADWLYHRARIGQPLHAFWVSSSSAAIPLPLLTWTINVFLGVGWISWVLASTLGGIMFLWMSRNLLKAPRAKVSARICRVALTNRADPSVVKHQRLVRDFVVRRLTCLRPARRWLAIRGRGAARNLSGG